MGGDRRAAELKHAAAVARLQARIAQAARLRKLSKGPSEPEQPHRPVAAADHERAVRVHYTGTLQSDEEKRVAMPTPSEIYAEHERLMKRIEAGDADPGRNPVGMFNVYADFELKAGARHFDQNNRTRRLSALRSAVNAGDIQPSYGWRHRFKTQGRELGTSDRVLDAIQGHPGSTASDNYGDVTISAKLKVIDALPDYDLRDRG